MLILLGIFGPSDWAMEGEVDKFNDCKLCYTCGTGLDEDTGINVVGQDEFCDHCHVILEDCAVCGGKIHPDEIEELETEDSPFIHIKCKNKQP